MDIIQEKGFNFAFDPRACKKCGGRCCTGESGNIWVNKEEINRIAGFMDLSAENFINYYLKKVHYRYWPLHILRELHAGLLKRRYRNDK